MKINKFKSIVLTCLLILMVSILFSQVSPVKVTQFVLSNGLTVILNEDHSKPQIFGVVVTKAGAKNDPAEASGLAHYQEHMLFKGTEQLGTTNWEAEKPHIDKIFELYDELGKTKDDTLRKKIQKQINEESLQANKYAIPNEIDKIIKTMGGTDMNANTTYDRTVFFNAFPAGQLEKWLELYSHRFMNPVFRSFQSELEVVYEEKNLYADMFQMNLLEAFQAKFFKNHPYGRPVIGTIDHLKNPSLTKMYNFFRTYYVANNMALVLSGDFNTNEVIPLIEKKFGQWRQGKIPDYNIYKEDSFKGREVYIEKLSPIKLAVLGFRTVPNGNPDEIALDVCNKILSNSNETGLLDKLALDNKLLTAMMISMQMNDYGAGIILVIPKIFGQSLEQAEKLVTAQLDKLKKGEFDDWMIAAIKNELYREFEQNMESIEGKAVTFAEVFSQNRSIDDYLTYPEKLKIITKDDIIRVANKYYGKNYMAFYSKMGFPKKQKIDKPGYKPVISNMNVKSAFARKLDTIPSKTPEIKYIDFDNDVKMRFLSDKIRFYYTTNPKNDIFSLTIRYGIGNLRMPVLKYASQMMNYSGTAGKDIKKLKEEFSKIGCTYNISSDDSYLSVEIEGLENNMPEALKLINELITKPVLQQDKLKILINSEKANRKIESSEPNNTAGALFEYIRYKNKSSYIDRLSMKELKALKAARLTDAFRDATSYEMELHYIGTKDINEIVTAFNNNMSLFDKDLKVSESPVVQESEKYNENIVFLVDKNKAVQSKIFLFSNGSIYDKSNDPYIDAFNMYFSGDFSGLVLQELREYRSLAYGAGARYTIPVLSGKSSDFYGFVGTQSDKTIESLNVFDTLIHHMPEKPDRIGMIKEYLIQSSIAAKPGFRDLSITILNWKHRGYTEDPLKSKLPVYNKLTFDDILTFYKKNIYNKPLVIAIVGNKSRIDMKELAKYGKIVELKEDDIFRK